MQLKNAGGWCSPRRVVPLCVVAVIGIAHQASAELLVYEPFEYEVGTQLDGQNGGIGWDGGWYDQAQASGATIEPGLSHPGLPSSGGSVLLSAEDGTQTVFRDFPEIGGTDGTSTWISFIGQRLGEPTTDDNPYGRGTNVGFFNGDNTGRTERITAGNSTSATENVWALMPTGRGDDIEPTNNPAVTYGGGSAAWVVMRIDHRGAALDDESNAPADVDDVYMWLDADPSSEPSLASANASVLNTDPNAYDYSGLDFIRPFIGNTSDDGNFGVLAVDEVRIGTTYASMSAVPEPSAGLLMLIAATVGWAWRRRSLVRLSHF